MAKYVFDEGGSSAILVEKNSCFSQQEKGISLLSSLRLLQNFKKKGKGKGMCFVCSSSEHWAKGSSNVGT